MFETPEGISQASQGLPGLDFAQILPRPGTRYGAKSQGALHAYRELERVVGLGLQSDQTQGNNAWLTCCLFRSRWLKDHAALSA